MNRETIFLIIVAIISGAVLVFTSPAFADNRMDDPRYIGAERVARNADGTIRRSSKVKSDFQKIWACPSTGLYTGACPGWQKDHIIPLVEGGADVIHNFQWLPIQIKTCKELWCKDRWERRVYSYPPQIVPMD